MACQGRNVADRHSPTHQGCTHKYGDAETTTPAPTPKPTPAPTIPLPESVDWVAAGAVTEPQSQGTCGCCYAFAATAAIESAYAIDNPSPAGKPAVPFLLSKQQSVDCDTEAIGWIKNGGCQGGFAVGNFVYAGGFTQPASPLSNMIGSKPASFYAGLTATGITLEETYPFTSGLTGPQCGSPSCQHSAAHANDCKSSVVSGATSSVKVSSFRNVELNDNALMAAIAKRYDCPLTQLNPRTTPGRPSPRPNPTHAPPHPSPVAIAIAAECSHFVSSPGFKGARRQDSH